MDMRSHFGFLALMVMAGAAPLPAQSTSDASTSSQPREAAVDAAAPAGQGEAASPAAALIARGEAVFNGPGNCYACHGSRGAGSIAPSLADETWIHSKGTLEEITAQVVKGVPKEEAKSGIPMPPKGGGALSDDDVKAVAAYVYSLRQK